MEDNILEKTSLVIKKIMNLPKNKVLTRSTRLAKDLGIDPFDMTDICHSLEKVFHISLEDVTENKNAWQRFTLQDLLWAISKKLKNAPL